MGAEKTKQKTACRVYLTGNAKNCRSYFVRIEFPPVVEIGIKRGHYFPQKTTNEGPTLTNA